MTLSEIYTDYFGKIDRRTGEPLKPRPLWLLVCVLLGAVPFSFVWDRL